jgi:hypothetical protein
MVDQLSATWRREKRGSKTRSEMSDLGHLCYHNAYTLWTMDPWRGSPTKLSVTITLVLKVYRLKRVGQWPLHGAQSLQTRREWVRGNRVEQPDSQSGLGQNGHDGIWSGPMSMSHYDGLIMTAYPDSGSVLMRTDHLSSSGPLWKNWWDCVPTLIFIMWPFSLCLMHVSRI